MENSKKINFFRKMWYSIIKPTKYDEMKQEGVGASIKYFFKIIAICALILAIIATILQVSIVKDAISYLEENLPEIKFQNNKLSLENEEASILDDDKVKQYFGGTIVINPLLDEQKSIDEYNKLATERYNVVVFLNDEYIIITNKYDAESEEKQGIQITKYADISSKYIQDQSAEYNKNSVISYIRQRTSYSYYIAQYFVFYFAMIAILYIIYILLISSSLWLVTKISKIRWTFKNSLMNTIYASTLSILIYTLYLIISYFARFRITFMDVITIALIFVYIFILIRKEKINIEQPKEEKENEKQ